VGELQDPLGLVDAVEVLSLHGDILPSDQASAHVLGLIRRGLRFAAVRCPRHTLVRSLQRAHNTQRYEHPSSASLVRLDRPDADFHAVVNFALTEFSEVRVDPILCGAARGRRPLGD
jgi:hypothetical protein